MLERIEPLLRDVHRMLEIERRSDDDPAFNFSVASGLFSVIAGLSRLFFSATRDDRSAFPTAAVRYPLSLEPGAAASPAALELFAEELYKVYRCNLVHSLGLTLEWSATLGRWEIVTTGTHRKVTRHNVPLSPAHLAELNDVTTRPKWLEPTLAARDGVVRLNAEALYWGVRRLTVDLAQNTLLRGDAERFIRPWYAAKQAMDFAVQSSAVPHLTTFSTVDATVGPATSTAVNSG